MPYMAWKPVVGRLCAGVGEDSILTALGRREGATLEPLPLPPLNGSNDGTTPVDGKLKGRPALPLSWVPAPTKAGEEVGKIRGGIEMRGAARLV